jgi:AmpD protein
MVVIHNISLPPNEFGGRYIEDFFQNQLDPTAHPYFATIEHLKVSSHLLIKRNGAVVQFVQFADKAWHAGVSHYRGRDNWNDFSTKFVGR